jgi:branched-chain amino acid transport system substrate-binding protein
MNMLKLVYKSMWRLIPAGLLIVIVAFYIVNRPGKKPIRVGFAAQLTGVQAELGVQERNGVQLAVEKINADGGVAGRPVELIVQDDLGTPEGAQTADRELIQAGVVAIIGHATSEQTVAGLNVTNPAHVVMLSPTASTPKLSDRVDYFFRVTQTLVPGVRMFARRVYQDHNLTRIAAIYDTDNTAFSKAFLETFADKYRSLGGRMAAEVGFSSKAQPDFAPFVAQLRASNPDGLLIIAADIDTALIAQRTRLKGWPIPLFASAWAQTETLISNGGRAVEGLEIECGNRMNSQAPDYLAFKTRYHAKFREDPTYGAALGYEAANVLAVALKKTDGDSEGLAQALMETDSFNGLRDVFSFNKYGDVVRPAYLGVIRDGKFIDIKTMTPTKP